MSARGSYVLTGALATLCVATACSGPQRILNPRSRAAEVLAELSWFLIAGTLVPAVVVLALLMWIVLRSRRDVAIEPAPSEGRLIVGSAVAVALILVVLLGSSLWTNRRLVHLEGEPDLTVEVIAHQFWWEVRYPDLAIVTANELHLPAGKRTRVLLTSADVIHSFWVPEVHGKLDALPGRVQSLLLEPREPGLLRGQCAEFCGIQHALMSMWVVSLSPDRFSEWVEARQQRSGPVVAARVERGRAVFGEAGCAHCHVVQGDFAPVTAAAVGPDLTHLAVRMTLGAATIENTPENLRAWIRHPNRIKPGVKMPATPLPDDAMDALVTYLSTLR